MVPDAVLWDMDGTLVDSEKLWDIPLYEAAERLGGRLSPTDREQLVGSNMDTTVLVLFTVLGLPVENSAMAETAGEIRRRTRELFTAGLPWRPGAKSALRAVRASGVATGLVTSTERELTEVALHTIGREHFDVTVCGDEVDGHNKPHPEPYLRAARLLGVDPARCVAVEDSPTGAASAEAAGCMVLVVPCDVEVPGGPRRVWRDGLVGVDAAELGALLG
ncbi:MAG: HAD family hydrolase [Sciscionella sp.]